MDEREDLFRDLCEDSPDLIHRVSLDGLFLYVNRAWLESLGYEPEEVAKLSLLDIIHPDSRHHFEQTYLQQLSSKAATHLVVKLRGKDSRVIIAEGTMNGQYRGGKVVATYGIFRDIGKRRQAEEGLDHLFNLSLDLLCIAGVDGFFKKINPAFVNILGYSQEELLSRSFLEFVHPDDQASTLREVERLAQGLPVVDFQNRYRARDGTYRWLAWRSAPWAERGLIYAVARDITEQKKTQELMIRQADELARSNADLEQFANVASHDLRAPLRGVANLTDWIEEDMPEKLPDKVRSNLKKIRDTVGRMERLMDDILRYSCAGRDPEEIRMVDTGAMLEELVLLLSPPDGFSVKWDPGMPVFKTAASPLEQVFRNLINNAITHHNRQDGKITVTVHDQPSFYEFSVGDDGPGIATEYHEKIFAMFQKGCSGTQVEGNGIGLALVKRIVEVYKGRVWVESAEGSGATLRFTWPKQINSAEGNIANHSDS